MKLKNYINFFALSLAIILFGCSKIVAQPTLTATANGLSAAMGVDRPFSRFTYVYEGPAGASQTWNFDTLSSPGGIDEFYTTCPQSFAVCDSFPEATFVAYDLTDYNVYRNTSANATTVYGSNSSGLFTRYTDPEEEAHFPFTYNSNFLDSFKSYTRYGGSTSTDISKEWGVDSVIADGWGTITTPIGRFTNVLRIKTVRNTVDSDGVSGLSYVRSVQYAWYCDTLRSYVFEVTHTYAGTDTTNATYWRYANSAPSAVKNVLASVGMQVMPNPTTDFLSVNVQTKAEKQATIVVTDATGRVYYDTTQQLAAGSTKLLIDMRAMPAGLYFVAVSSADGKILKKVEKL